MSENKKEEFVTLIHRDAYIYHLSEFMNKEQIYNITPQDLFEINRELIWSQITKQYYQNQYLPDDFRYKKVEDLNFEMILPRPCNLKIPAKYVQKELLISNTNLQTNEDNFFAFSDENIQNAITEISSSIISKDSSYSKISPKCTVIFWSKSLNTGFAKDSKENQSEERLINASKYVTSLNTFVDKNGGNFTIKLPCLLIDRESFGIGGENDSFYYQRRKVEKGLEDYKKVNFDSNFDYFSNMLQNNDLVFIKFDNNKVVDENKLEFFQTEENSLANENFDLIGLIDNVSVSKSAQSADSIVEISGRDLVKLLIDDSSNFFNVSTTNSPESIFSNSHSFGDSFSVDTGGGKFPDPIKRVRRLKGEIDVFSNRTNMSISFILKGVISQLANIEIIDSNFFYPWGNKRTTFKQLSPKK